MNGFTTITLELGTVELATGALGGHLDRHLTPTELKLLAFLVGRRGAVVTKEVLLAEVWGLPPGAGSRTVFATIERLRRKIERDPKNPCHVVTIGRSGYSFRALEVAPPEPRKPLPATGGFVGRRAECAAVREALADEGAVVSVHGPGGVGKTRLVTELVGQLPWPATVCLLEGCGPADVLPRVARALDVVADPDPVRATARIGRVARDRVLVLDGVEGRVAEVAALVRGLGPVRPRVLVTTREPLRVEGERVVPLAPFAPPTPGAASEAVELFLVNAQRRRPGWVPAPADRSAIEALVTALDGLPLAIEVAASWSSVLEPREILLRLHRVGDRPVDPSTPGRTVEAAIRTSWDALDAAEQRALAACGAFAGPFTAAAAEVVLGGGEALDRLERLVERSLVQAEDRAGRRSFRLLALVSSFVRRMGEPRCAALARHRHAEWFGDQARTLVEALERGGSRATYVAVAAIEADLERVVADGAGAEAAMAALALAAVFKDLGPVPRWLGVVTETLQRDDLPDSARVRLLVSQAAALRYQGRATEAFPVLVEARALAQSEVPDRRGAVALAEGTLQFHCGDVVRSRACLEEALALALAATDAYGEAVARAELATLAWRAHHLERAAAGYREALRLFRRMGARHPEAVYLGNLGIVELTAGRIPLALDALTSALALHQELGSIRFECATRTNLGVLEERRGRNAESREHLLAALALAERTGDTRDHTIASLNLASNALALRRVTEARQWLDGLEDALVGLGLWLQAADAALCWANVHRLEGSAADANRALAVADALGERHDIPFVRTRARALQGLLAVDRGDRAEALRVWTDVEAALSASEAAPHEVVEAVELERLLALPGLDGGSAVH